MSLHSTDALIVEGITATESLPDPTTVSGRTHWLQNSFAGSQVWSSTGATPFVVDGVNVTTLTLLIGTTRQLYSNGTRWVVIPVITSSAAAQIFGIQEVMSASRFATYDRSIPTNATSFTSGHSYITAFTAPESLTTANIKVYVGLAGAASPTQSELSLYSLDASDNGTRIAVTASNLDWSTTGMKTHPWGAPVALVAGTRYAIGQYQSNGAGPGFANLGSSGGATGADLSLILPMHSGFISSTRVGASFLKSSVTSPGIQAYMYAELTT